MGQVLEACTCFADTTDDSVTSALQPSTAQDSQEALAHRSQGSSHSLLGLCAHDSAHSVSTTKSSSTGLSLRSRKRRSSETEPRPPDGPQKYVVVGLGGATIRSGVALNTPVVCTLGQSTIVEVLEVHKLRARIAEPVRGWGSIRTEKGYTILELLDPPRKFRVVFKLGAAVRNKFREENSTVVRMIPYGDIVWSTGRSRMHKGIERLKIADGWVSVCMTDRNGPGALVLEEILRD